MSDYDDYLDTFKEKKNTEYQDYLSAQPNQSSVPYSLESENLKAQQELAPYQELQRKALGIMAIPGQAAIAPFSQAATAASNLIQNKPQEPWPSSVGGYLEKYGSTRAPLETIPGMKDPIKSLGGLTGADIASPALDIGITHYALTPFAEKISEGTQSFLRDQADENRLKTLARISGLPSNVSQEVLEQGKYHSTVDTLKQYGIADKLSNPAALSEELNGKKIQTIDSFGRPAQIPDPRSPGLIDQVGKEVENAVNELDISSQHVDTNQLIDEIYNSVANKANDPNNMSTFTGKQDDALLKRLKDIFNPEDNPTKSVSDLVKIKRNAADMIYELKSGRTPLPVEGSTELGMHTETRNYIDDYINNLAHKGVPGALELVGKNSDYSNLLRAKDMLAGAPLESLTSANIPEAAASQVVGNTIGHPMMGARPAMGIVHQQLSVLPARTANIMESTANTLQNTHTNQGMIGSSLSSQVQQPPAAPSVQVNPQGRFPQSIPDMQQQLMMRKGLVENLAEFKIPRTVDGILNNKQLVLAKIAQTTNNKAIVDGLNDSLNMHPELLKDTLPALQMQFPQIFEPNRFPSWSNGKLLDPMDKQRAYQDVENKSGISNTQKAILQDGINRDGSFPERF